MTHPTDSDFLDLFERLAIAAGKVVMEVFQNEFAVDTKKDSSPVTLADRAAEAVILDGLRAAFPEIPCVAEEEASAGLYPDRLGDTFFLVDPLDGTREFVARNHDFTVNIALIRHGEPVIGVVFAPARKALYAGRPGEVCKLEGSALRQKIEASLCSQKPRLVASRSHRTAETDAFLARFADSEAVSVGSSLKFCLLASGEADIYPRFGPTMEWDTAAGDAILRAAGGMTFTQDGKPLRYGKRGTAPADFTNPSFIAVTQSATAHVKF